MSKYIVVDQCSADRSEVEANSYEEACMKATRILGVKVYKTNDDNKW